MKAFLKPVKILTALLCNLWKILKPLPRVRKPNLHSDRVDRIRTCALGDPSDPKARMVPLYHKVLWYYSIP
ncbi:hypothetical protein E2C01_014441 [Portunus trituberculatus]|uniref:Uncharacterized protein n=1 Tax=Portunus trituberculatus TaxID=210409 RepID=A0A5B7DKG9_PORTR|nr:hypothetical protein [Portunus trituberculatus]